LLLAKPLLLNLVRTKRNKLSPRWRRDDMPSPPRRWQFDSRLIYVRPRTGLQSAHGQAVGSQRAYSVGQLRRGTDKRTDRGGITSGQRILTKGRIVPVYLSPPRRVSPCCPCGQVCCVVCCVCSLLHFSSGQQTQKLSLALWESGDPHPPNIHGSSNHTSSQPKRHLDRFSRFCVQQQTHRQTDRQSVL